MVIFNSYVKLPEGKNYVGLVEISSPPLLLKRLWHIGDFDRAGGA